MPIKDIPKGFKLEVGSTVKVLTTAAIEEKNRSRKKHKNYEDYKDLKDFKDGKDHKDCKDHKECKDSKDFEKHKDFEEHKVFEKQTDFEDFKGIFTGIVLDENEFKLKRDADGSPNWKQYDKKSKDKPPINVEEEEQFLVLALTRPSNPFSAGQIVWIQLDQIVALSAIL